ncbi:hypothetical protein LCGC14_1724510, partial [marine sediment metagenome]
KNFTTDCSVLVLSDPSNSCGPLSCTGDNGQTSVNVQFYGAGSDETVIPGSASVFPVTINGSTKTIIFEDIGITDDGGSSHKTLNAVSGGSLKLKRCRIGSSSGSGMIIKAVAVTAWDTSFIPNQAANFSLDMDGSSKNCIFHDCTFSNTIRTGGDQTFFFDCVHANGAVSKGFLSAQGGVNKALHVFNSEFRGNAGAWVSFFDFDGENQTWVIKGCHGGGGATQAILVGSAYNVNGSKQVVTGNDWSCELGINHTASSTEMYLDYTGNQHASTLATGTPIIAQGKFFRSTFEANGPAGSRVDLQAGSTMCKINGMLIDITNAGAPTHTANQGSLYLDADSNTLYMNTSATAGTTWVAITVGGAFPFALGLEYAVSHWNTDRTFNANEVTLHELADVVGTLIHDLSGT